jgi:hypothetical protein
MVKKLHKFGVIRKMVEERLRGGCFAAENEKQSVSVNLILKSILNYKGCPKTKVSGITISISF